jgi:hypothetical protein
MIEREDFDVEKSTYNIGIPTNTINRPSAPTFVSDIEQAGDLSYNITGLITQAAGSNESKYRVSVLRRNMSAPYTQKEFLKEADGTTNFQIKGLKDSGEYIVTVTALRNPESSMNVSQNLSIKQKPFLYIKSFISNVDLNVIGNHHSYSIKVKNNYGEYVMLDKSEYSINIYAVTENEEKQITSNHKDNIFNFTEITNNITFGEFKDSYTLKFELLKNQEVLGDFTYSL